MRGVRPMLFGIAMIIWTGFIMVHDLLQSSGGWEYRKFTPLAVIGLLLGFAIVTIGFVYGTLLDTRAKNVDQ